MTHKITQIKYNYEHETYPVSLLKGPRIRSKDLWDLIKDLLL